MKQEENEIRNAVRKLNEEQLTPALSNLTNALSKLDMVMRNQLWADEDRELYFFLRMNIARNKGNGEAASAYATFINTRFIETGLSKELRRSKNSKRLEEFRKKGLMP